jgi:hypothetical protein
MQLASYHPSGAYNFEVRNLYPSGIINQFSNHHFFKTSNIFFCGPHAVTNNSKETLSTVTAKQIMLFTHASVKDKTHIQMGKCTLTVSYFSTHNKEQKYITRHNTQYKTIQKWDAGMTDTTHAQYHVWLRLQHITTLLNL